MSKNLSQLARRKGLDNTLFQKLVFSSKIGVCIEKSKDDKYKLIAIKIAPIKFKNFIDLGLLGKINPKIKINNEIKLKLIKWLAPNHELL